MALIISKNYDKVYDKVIGFGFPLSGEAIFNPIYTTREQIKANLINYFLTNKKERIFNSTFGANLGKLLFENIGPNKNLDNIKSYLEIDLKRYFPLIEIIDLNINQTPDEHILELILTYKFINSDVNDSINIILQ